MIEGIQIFDDVLPDPDAYRAAALTLSYQDVVLGDDTFRGIALPADPLAVARLVALLPDARPTLTFLRRSPHGQPEPTFVHSDAAMGSWTAILYLNQTPPPSDGTTFWRHRATDRIAGPWTAPLAVDTYNHAAWVPRLLVPARYNRLLVFDAALYHSRGVEENYGIGDTARLVQVTFGTWTAEAAP